MANPVTTTLKKIITLAHQQMGIRFQLSTEQLVEFANMIQYIAYNKDEDAFIEYSQKVKLGHDIVFQDEPGYIAPIDSDLNQAVIGNTLGFIGTLLNFQTLNRENKWVVAPVDGLVKTSIPAGEIITLLTGSAATGRTNLGQAQALEVSNGPYRMPDTVFGNPPCRKLIGITQITDEQTFGVPPNSAFDGFDDYGVYLNGAPGRHQNYPYRLNIEKQEITMISSTPPEIIVSDTIQNETSEFINTSKLRWIYYKNCPPITSINDEAALILPERYRYEVIYKGISLLADIATYGEAGTVRQLIEPVCEKFWEDMRYQYEQYGRNSSYISEGDTWIETTGRSRRSYYAGPYRQGVGW